MMRKRPCWRRFRACRARPKGGYSDDMCRRKNFDLRHAKSVTRGGGISTFCVKMAVVFGLLIQTVICSRTTAAAELTTVHDLKNLSHEQSVAGCAVKIKGVVVCYDSGWNQLYVCDGKET